MARSHGSWPNAQAPPTVGCGPQNHFTSRNFQRISVILRGGGWWPRDLNPGLSGDTAPHPTNFSTWGLPEVSESHLVERTWPHMLQWPPSREGSSPEAQGCRGEASQLLPGPPGSHIALSGSDCQPWAGLRGPRNMPQATKGPSCSPGGKDPKNPTLFPTQKHLRALPQAYSPSAPGWWKLEALEG